MVNASILESPDGDIYGAKVFPADGSGHVRIVKRAHGVIRSVEVDVWHPTNGQRGRTFHNLELDEQDQTFTTLLLRSMAAPMDERLLFSNIPGAWL